MASLNKACLIGNLGRDPETRRSSAGNPVVTFSIATTESWRDKASGERRDRTEWHNIVIWNEALGKVAEQYLSKGDKAYVEGQIQTREYTDKDGNPRKATDIVLSGFDCKLVLLGGKRGVDDANGNAARPGNNGGATTRGDGGEATSGRRSKPVDDDIPF